MSHKKTKERVQKTYHLPLEHVVVSTWLKERMESLTKKEATVAQIGINDAYFKDVEAVEKPAIKKRVIIEGVLAMPHKRVKCIRRH